MIQKGNNTYFNKEVSNSKFGFDRDVESLIQEAIANGDFKNLSGYGKPLLQSQTHNPHVDFAQHKINKIMLDNGFCPEWIMLKKEIRLELQDLKNFLQNQRLFFGNLPLSTNDENDWNTAVMKYQTNVDNINTKIDKYNFLVPILNNQMLRVQLNKIAEMVLNEKPINLKPRKLLEKKKSRLEKEQKGLMSFIASFF